MELKEFHTADLTIVANFDEVFNFVWNNGRALKADMREFDNIVCYIDPADAGFSKIIYRDSYRYLAEWHYRNKDGKEGWDIDLASTLNGSVEDLIRKITNPEPKVETIPVDVKVIKDIIQYCEDKAIYDKLGYYGDFYYRLKNLVGNDE